MNITFKYATRTRFSIFLNGKRLAPTIGIGMVGELHSMFAMDIESELVTLFTREIAGDVIFKTLPETPHDIAHQIVNTLKALTRESYA